MGGLRARILTKEDHTHFLGGEGGFLHKDGAISKRGRGGGVKTRLKFLFTNRWAYNRGGLKEGGGGGGLLAGFYGM